MKDGLDERFPHYVRGYYRVYATIRKIYRQAMTRISESRAREMGGVRYYSGW